MIIDSHCHLTIRFEKNEITDVLHRAKENGVSGIILVGYDPENYRGVLNLLEEFESGQGEKYPALAGSIGIHPHEADKFGPGDIESFGTELERKSIVAIGETGLDFFRDYAERDRQEELFRAQVRLCSETGYPLIIHSRAAFQRTVEILREFPLPEKPGVFHCYGYGPDEVKTVLELGFFISIAGNVTYPKETELQKAVEIIPDNRILIETDSPFLIPQKAKNRKVRRNEPSLVVETAEKICEIKGWDKAKTSENLVYNTTSCFPALRDIEPWSRIKSCESWGTKN